MNARHQLTVCLVVAACVGAVQQAAAQSVRISGTTTVRYLELQPLQIDSVPVGSTQGDGVLRRSNDGQMVECVDPAPYCYTYDSGSAVSSAPGLQDLHVSAWGFGRGIRLYAHLRGRAVVAGSASLWPLANDHFDAMEAYLELERPHFRVRVGRQFEVNGLDFGNFDGASVLLRPLPELSVEGYGGWSLETGLNEAVTSGAIAAVEPFAPDSRGLLLGLQARARPVPALSLSAVYERVIRQDRAGLYSERVGTDGLLRGGRVALDWALQADLATGDLNELRGRVLYSPTNRVTLSGFARRHQPYFDLWTIWGAFGAVGFAEAGAGGSWRSGDGTLRVDAQAARRHYLDTGAGASFAPLRSDGWSLSASASADLAPHWSMDGQYGLNLGFGAAKSQGSARLQHTLRNGILLAASGTAFQMADELRVSSGTVVGLGLDGGVPVGTRSRVSGSIFGYRHLTDLPASGPNWSQLRASISFSWTLGPEPGLPAPGGM
jgi:hypothetical protein